MKKHLVITTNLYREDGDYKNGFDHPVGDQKIHQKLDIKLVRSLASQKVPKNINLSWHIILSNSATIKEKYLNKVKEKASGAFNNGDLKIFTFQNSKPINQISPQIFNMDTYPGIRNTAFALAYNDHADVLIQIDADEELPKDYLLQAVKVLDENPHIKALGGFYLEEGRRLSPLQDPLESWPKYSAMNMDATEIIAGNKVAESYFIKGGNMLLTRKFFSKMCFPTAIPRGEDFAMILRAWLTYYNGNSRAGIKPKNSTFKFWLNPNREMAIIHHTHHAAIRNFLSYLENNLQRFAIETNTIRNQKGLSVRHLRSDSTYIGKVIYLSNFATVVKTIYQELTQKAIKGAIPSTNPLVVALRASHHPVDSGPTYTKKQINNSKKRLLSFWEKIETKNYWREYQKEQAEYVKSLKQIKNLSISHY